MSARRAPAPTRTRPIVLTIRLSASEFAEADERRGEETMSAWVRRKLAPEAHKTGRGV